jgi:putative ABC transport system substrate-binding protein
MRRRDFVQGIAAAAACPVVARAQQPVSAPVVGWLNAGFSHDPLFVDYATAFRTALKEAGFIEGQNIAIDFRWAEGDYKRLPAQAADLVAKHVALIVAGGPAAVVAAKTATATIPIVFTLGADPVAMGLIESFSHPGGNATGINIVIEELESKRLGLLHEAVPGARTIAVFFNPNSPSFAAQAQNVHAAAQGSGVEIIVLSVATPADIDQAFITIRERRADALLVGGDPFLAGAFKQIVALAARQAIPAMYIDRQATAIGGLMSYSISFADAYRQAAGYTARILKGEKPGDLPVIRPTKFEFAINLKTAKQLGLTLSPGLLSIADEVIE